MGAKGERVAGSSKQADDPARDAGATDAESPAPDARERFRNWRRERPLIGGLLIALSGIALFLSSQLDLGNIRVQLGIEGLQATIIPIALVLLGILVITMPAHRIFYGVLALAVAVYSLVGVNLGGFFVGMLLGCVGGVLTVAWMPPSAKAKRSPETGADDSTTDEAGA